MRTHAAAAVGQPLARARPRLRDGGLLNIRSSAADGPVVAAAIAGPAAAAAGPAGASTGPAAAADPAGTSAGSTGAARPAATDGRGRRRRAPRALFVRRRDR